LAQQLQDVFKNVDGADALKSTFDFINNLNFSDKNIEGFTKALTTLIDKLKEFEQNPSSGKFAAINEMLSRTEELRNLAQVVSNYDKVKKDRQDKKKEQKEKEKNINNKYDTTLSSINQLRKDKDTRYNLDMKALKTGENLDN
jgi:hydroxylamine reductase (hybrid-cluster protein)